jgi:hypothetical protein
MTDYQRELRLPVRRLIASWTRLVLVGVTLVALSACGGVSTSPASTVSVASPSTGPAGSASGAAACIDAEAAAIIELLRAPGADVQTIITEQGDTLVAGLQRFTPPPDAAAWRDELVTSIESGDAAAVLSKVQMIGSGVVLQFC